MIPEILNIKSMTTTNRLNLHDSNGVLALEDKVTDNFTVGEWLESSKVLEDEYPTLVNEGIPIENQILEIAQAVRDHTGKPVYIGSSYRSYAWDKKKGRSGSSQHILGKAVDLNGEDVYELLHVAVMTQNEFYQQLKALGANFFGFYSWGVHIDTGYRQGQPDNMPMVRYYADKKKSDLSIGWAVALISLFMYRKSIFKLLKLRF